MFGLIDYVIFAMFGAFCLLDLVYGARAFPVIRGWRTRGIISFAVYFAMATYLPFLWDSWLGAHRLVDATAWPLWAAVIMGTVAYEGFLYAWHRTMHNVDFLWRWFHQMHHSAERVDIFGAFYFHPLDITAFTFLGSFALVMVIGVSPQAAVFINVILTFLAMFQHANLKTPRWLGYIIVRPESHSVHHEQGVHRYNYSDLPLFDILFGTFRNPKTWEKNAGFFPGGSWKIAPMLAGRKIAE